MYLFNYRFIHFQTRWIKDDQYPVAEKKNILQCLHRYYKEVRNPSAKQRNTATDRKKETKL